MKNLIIILFGVVVVLAGVFLWPGPKPVSHQYFAAAPKDRAEVIAHGGGLGVAPENTLVSLEQAALMRADVLEVDVNLSKDEKLIIIHDHTLDRTTDVTGPVADRAAAELRLVDAGYGFTKDDRFVGQNIYPPTLDEAFTAHPKARWVIEIKNRGVRTAQVLCHAIQQYAATDRVLAASFHDEAIKAFRAACPEVATSMSSEEVQRFYMMARLGLSRFVSTPAVAIQIPPVSETDDKIDLTNRRFVSAAKSRGIKVHYWTINDPDEMKRLVSKGADGIITDYVEVILNEQK